MDTAAAVETLRLRCRSFVFLVLIHSSVFLPVVYSQTITAPVYQLHLGEAAGQVGDEVDVPLSLTSPGDVQGACRSLRLGRRSR